MRQEVEDRAGWMRVHAREDVGDVIDGIHAVLLAARDECVEDGEIVASVFVSDKEKILSAECDATEPRFRDVVVRCDSGESEEASELTEVAQEITDGAPETGTRLERVTVTSAPSQERGEEWSRARLSESKVLGGADDAGALRVVLDSVDGSDEVERFAGLGMLTLLEELAARVGETTGAHSFSWLGDRVVAGELIDDQKAHDGSKGPSNMAATAKSGAARYADRYFGVSAAERRYYQQLGVDPYTNNKVLRKAVAHLAKINAATNLGMHFAGVPGLPYLGDVRRAMDAIYNEDPAVLRARQRLTLAGYGLTTEEIKRFENTLLLSPTRQRVLEEEAKLLEGVAGRDELFRHAMSVTSEEEVQVFLQSTRLLAAVHKQHPIARILAGLRLPTAQTSDGHIVVIGAFDAVYWTEDVAGYEEALHAALPPAATGLQLWLSGSISPRARSELIARGWDVHEIP